MELFRSLCRNEGEVWLVFGVFNEILYQGEKFELGEGGRGQDLRDRWTILGKWLMNEL